MNFKVIEKIEDDFREDSESIVDSLIEAYKMVDEEILLLHENKIFRFMLEYPYVSGQSYPKEVAILNGGHFIAAMRVKGAFASHKYQTIRERISLCLLRTDDDPRYREAALLLLELASLNDHNSDRGKDIKRGKNNPINDGIICFPDEKKRLEDKIKGLDEFIKCDLNHFIEDIQELKYWL